MTDIAIRHCDLRIRRMSAGETLWLDGGDHKRLAERVQALVLPMLDELLAPRIAAHDTADALDIRLDLALDMRDLSGAAPLARPALRSRLSGAVAQAVSNARAVTQGPGKDPNPPHDRPRVENTQSTADELAPDASDPFDILDRLAAHGHLPEVLSFAKSPALLHLLTALLARADGQYKGLSTQRAETRETPSPTGELANIPDRALLIRAILALAGASADQQGNAKADGPRQSLAHPSPEAIDTARALLTAAQTSTATAIPTESIRSKRGAPDAVAEKMAPQDDVADRPRSDLAPNLRAQVPKNGATTLGSGRHAIASALPFLLLGPLSRHGVLDALCLDPHARDWAQAFGFALAQRALPPAPGGARWPDAARSAAAQLAGLTDPVPGAQLARAARETRAGRDLAQAGIAAVLLGTLAPLRPLPLIWEDGTAIAFDPCGLYPICHGPIPDIAGLLRATGRFLFLARPDPALWSALAEEGLPAFADGPPARGERCAPVTAPGGWRGRSNRNKIEIAPMRSGLADAAQTAARADEVWSALRHGPPLVAEPRQDADVRAFEDLAAALAGFALADIGWALSHRDPVAWAAPDPLLVRDRFADLSGWLDIGPGQVTIVLPLGRRFSDLRDAGLLDTLHGVPWWPGREIAFRGG